MRLAELAQPFARLAHGCHCLAIRVEPQDLTREASGKVQLLIGPDQQAARQSFEFPRLDEAAVGVKDLHAPILAVGHEDLPLAIDENRMRLIELAVRRSFAA